MQTAEYFKNLVNISENEYISKYTWNFLIEVTNKKLNGFDLRYAKLNNAELNYAKLNYAELNGVKLNGAELNNAELNYAKLNNAKLNYAELNGVKLNGAELNNAELNYAKLNNAKLNYAKLNGAELNGVKLNRAEFNNAELNGAKGLLNSSKWLKENFKYTSEGLIVYKAFGNTFFPIPEYWKVEKNSIIEEEVNYSRTNDCGCGINVATIKWIENNLDTYDELWKCLIMVEDLNTIVVPYNTNGKFRCGRLKLIERIN